MVRSVVFWLHLVAGVVAGVVILVMSATGVALTYERQLNAWTTSHLRSVVPSSGAAPLPLETLAARVSATRTDVTPMGFTVSSAPDGAVTIQAESVPLFVDAYDGHELGERRGAGLRTVLSTLRGWHRWLGVAGENRSAARAISGWSNLLFLFIVMSGAYLWLPRTWRWLQVRQTLWFKRAYGTSKARDFNWHHVIGIWSAVPLFVIVLGAVPMSFPWANDALYRVVGEEPPMRGRPGPEGGRISGNVERPTGQGRAVSRDAADTRDRREASSGNAAGRHEEAGRTAVNGAPRTDASPRPVAASLDGLDIAFARARSESPDWRTISVRLPRRVDDPLAFTIDTGDGGQPQRRSTLTVTRNGDVVSRETFGDQPRGRQLRSVLRFAHTGEVFGIAGQTVAGLATLGAVIMVWTGLALSWRRLLAWRSRRSERSSSSMSAAALTDVTPLTSQESIS